MTGIPWSEVQLREPLWLLLALQPLLSSLFISLQYRRHRRAYADARLLPWVVADSGHDIRGRQLLRILLLQFCWLLIAVSMAGPRYPDPQQAADLENAADVMVLVDVSRSMTATDVRPDRLRRVRIELNRLLEQKTTDRIGIILFAGHAHLLSPLTRDRDALRFYAASIQAGLLPTEGSNLGEAIVLASRYLQDSHTPAILVLTDGETHDAIETKKELHGTPLYINGVGSEAGSTIAAREGGWLTHENRPVRTRLQSIQLQALARSSGGAYITLSDETARLDAFYQRLDGSRSADRGTASGDHAWIELYHLLLIPALLMLLLMSLPQKLPGARLVRSGVLLLGLSVGLMHENEANAQLLSAAKDMEAYTAYAEKDYRKAMEIYAIHTGYVARMGEGSSAYQLEDHARALTQYTRAFQVAESDMQRADALYNLANSFFQLGQYNMALETYKDVLRYNPQHLHAQANLEFVQSVLDSMSQDPFASSARARRAGRGPRSLKADENTRGSGDFSLDDEETLPPSSTGKSQQQQSGLLDIIASGKGRVQVADESEHVQGSGTLAPVTVTQLLHARSLIGEVKRDQAGLWKALFEEEEGFPAPLEQPVSEAGVPPW